MRGGGWTASELPSGHPPRNRGNSKTTFGYDDLNRLTSAAYPAGYGTWGWTYDEVGNRLTQTGPSGTTTYTYDGNNRLTQATAGTTTTYSYDDNGNLTGISTGQTFTWDVFNRLIQATGAGGTANYTYNGAGIKTRRVGPDGTRRYYHDGTWPIWETDDAGVMTAQYDRDIFGNLLSRREASGARRYYHFDGIGSMTALTNETGTVTSSLLYDAWGNQRAATGSDQGRYRFTGAELDQATGLYHMGARFYDPTIGRWLSEDPAQDKPFEPATLNFYAYVRNNPMLRVDLTGTTDDGGGGSSSPSIADQVRAWIEEGGIEYALNQLRAAWAAYGALLDELAAAGLSWNDLKRILTNPLNGPVPPLKGNPTFKEVVQYYQFAARCLAFGTLGALIQASRYVRTRTVSVFGAGSTLALFGSGVTYGMVARSRDLFQYGGRAFFSLEPWEQAILALYRI